MQALHDTGMGHWAKSDLTRTAPLIRTIDRPLDLIDLHRSNPSRYPHLLKSSAHGRFDILFALPGDSLVLDSSGRLVGPAGHAARTADFLNAFDQWWEQLRSHTEEGGALPFTGGWFVYLGYELAAQIEPRLKLPATEGAPLPVAMATRFRSAVIHDHREGTTVIVAEEGCADLADIISGDVLELRVPHENGTTAIDVVGVDEAPGLDYLNAIEQIHNYIREGDVFQVNLSRQWNVTLSETADIPTLYKKLGQHNPSPYGGVASWPEAAIISSSPERLVRVQGRTIETRPIAGTRPRGSALAADTAYSRELMSHPKERAEHIMLIDLERNDLGRICVPGSVEVNEFMVLESYAHVHHIVSNVRGELQAAASPGQVIRAVFPGGTITGCPKVRCMEIIAELEQQGRGAYTGSMGYINRDGNMDLNILIRSMVSSGSRVSFRAGAGIVADSVAVAELEETRAKARGLLRALGIDDV